MIGQIALVNSFMPVAQKHLFILTEANLKKRIINPEGNLHLLRLI